jgi:hypothetical protein
MEKTAGVPSQLISGKYNSSMMEKEENMAKDEDGSMNVHFSRLGCVRLRGFTDRSQLAC